VVHVLPQARLMARPDRAARAGCQGPRVVVASTSTSSTVTASALRLGCGVLPGRSRNMIPPAGTRGFRVPGPAQLRHQVPPVELVTAVTQKVPSPAGDSSHLPDPPPLR